MLQSLAARILLRLKLPKIDDMRTHPPCAPPVCTLMVLMHHVLHVLRSVWTQRPRSLRQSALGWRSQRS